MQGLKSYKKELEKKQPHNMDNLSHILKVEDYLSFAGFSEKEIWGETQDDISNYEKWIKEQK